MIETSHVCPRVDHHSVGPIEDRPQTKMFEAISRELLGSGNAIRFQARGASMSPAIHDGEIVHVKAVLPADLRKGDIVLVKGEMGFRLHRLVVADVRSDVFITRGDSGSHNDPAVSAEQIVGIAGDKEVRVGNKTVRAKLNGMSGRILTYVARGQRVLTKRLSRASSSSNSTAKNASALPVLLALLFLLFAATYSMCPGRGGRYHQLRWRPHRRRNKSSSFFHSHD